jgi:hypothetical protein
MGYTGVACLATRALLGLEKPALSGRSRDTKRPALSFLYSPTVVEGEFCELRIDVVLRSSQSPRPMLSGVLTYMRDLFLSYIRLRCYHG